MAVATRAPRRDAGSAAPAAAFVTQERFLMFVLDEMAAALERDHDDVVRLTLGKSELPPDEPVVAAMVAAAGDYAKAGLVHPAGLPELRARLAEEYRRQYDVAVPQRQIVVGAGTSSVVRNVVQLLAGPGDEVVVPLPYYPLYPFTARLAGATVRHYRIDQDTMRVDLDSVRAVVNDRTRVVVVNSPGNPLGNVVSPAEFRAVDEIVAGRAVLVSDEIYGNVLFDDEPYSAIELRDSLRCPLVVTNAFSKGHRMYARRVGYAVVPEELVDPLTVVQHHTLLTADPVSQFGAIAALDHQDGVRELTTRYRARRDHTVARFADAPGVRALPARGSFYLTLECTGHLARHDRTDTVELAEHLLRETHVATVPGMDFGTPTTLRLSYSAHRYEEAVDRLAAYFHAH